MKWTVKIQWTFYLIILGIYSLYGQNIANRGLTHKQAVETLPKSKVPVLVSTPKQKVHMETSVSKVGDNDYLLDRGWELAENRKVIASRQSIFDENYSTRDWYNATVPGTVLTTLVDQGIYPDPYFGLNNLEIPDSLCREDWWYRLEFTSPVHKEGREVWLEFNGINYQAEIWLNGSFLGLMKGAFVRGVFNATSCFKEGQNILAVHILPPPNSGIPHEQSPAGNGMNGGQLCLDGPTFISSEGWDWVPGIRDRNIGLWQDVHLRFTRGIRLHDTQVVTSLNLPDTTEAKLTVKTVVENLLSVPKRVEVALKLEGSTMLQQVSLSPGERKAVSFTSDKYPGLDLMYPRLWWPNGYGRQELYTMGVEVQEGGRLSDVRQVRFGVRELSYELEVCFPDDSIRRVEYRPVEMCHGKPLFDNINRKYLEGGMCIPRLRKDVDPSVLLPAPDKKMEHYLVVRVNGKRIFCRGGNWGMDDAMKRVSRSHLEPYFRLHKEAHFNMIRNWTGESTEELFYELCDEYGMLVFNDFWLSTEGYNLGVNDDDLFLRNAKDVVDRFRNHPCIAIWNPRNEGFAPPYIEEHLNRMIAEEDGTRHYNPNSTHCNLRPSGPWNFFKEPANYYKFNAHGFNTEQGTTSIPTEESILGMMDKKDAWPIDDVWYYHDLHGGQKDYMSTLNARYGTPSDLGDFCKKAQMLNYDSHRAMLESWNSKMWNSTSGLLLWMSHPAWPSMVWQVYSWDYETFGSFYGCRKACEPVHIQMNLDNREVVVINTTLREIKGSTAIYELYDLSGKLLSKRTKKVDVRADALTVCFGLKDSALTNDICLERFILKDKSGRLLSLNDYWKGNKEGDFLAMNDLKEPLIRCKMKRSKKGTAEIELQNTGGVIAVSLKLNVRESDTEKRILPVYISDGYFNLLPGERKTVTLEGLPGKEMAITAEGYNLERKKLIVFNSTGR